MKEKRNQMKLIKGGATDWIWASISWKGSLTVARNTQLLGLWTQRCNPPDLCSEVPWGTALWAHFISRQPQELGMSEIRKFLTD